MRSDDAAHSVEAQAFVPERAGAYTIYEEIGAGGMATVHLGKLESASGFSRLVAINRMHAELARSSEFVEMFLQEARLVGRIQHPNVVAALDCVADSKNVMLVMEYVHGVSLHQLMRKPTPLPLPIASAVLVGAALGLHAAHESVDEAGRSLGIVHRDVSPHNILVGVDGIARVLDFGIAKAAESVHHTRTGEIKGKLSYMSPEQLLGGEVRRQADVYSLGVVLWELVTGRRLFKGEGTGLLMMRVASGQIEPPRAINPRVSPDVEAVVMKALARSPQARYRTALEFAMALERAIPHVAQRALGEWVAQAAQEELVQRALMRARVNLSPYAQRRDADADLATTRRFGPVADEGAVSRIAVIRRRPSSMSVASMTGAVLFAFGIGIGAVAAWSRFGPSSGTESRSGRSAAHVLMAAVPPLTQLTTDQPANILSPPAATTAALTIAPVVHPVEAVAEHEAVRASPARSRAPRSKAGALLLSPTGGARDSAPSGDRDLDAIGGRQ